MNEHDWWVAAVGLTILALCIAAVLVLIPAAAQ